MTQALRLHFIFAMSLVLASCDGTSTPNPSADAGRIGCGSDNGGCGPTSAWICYESTGGVAVCTDRNECLQTPEVCSQDPAVSCTNTTGGYTCGECPTGYSGDGHYCLPDDRCLLNNGGCGSPEAWACSNGVGQTPTCADIDECATPGFCSTNPPVSCTNLVGGYQCGACPSGYSGDGRTCPDINECVDNTDGCPSTSACRNYPGGFACDACGANRVVSGAPGDSERCVCAPGYTYNFSDCRQICADATNWIIISNDVARDLDTTLFWQRGSSPTQLSFDDAIAYCDNLALDGWGNWRLPTRTELESIVEPSLTPKAPMCPFPVTSTTTYYWTSTVIVANSSSYVVGFGNGMTTWASVSNLLEVRCVR